MCVCVCFLWTPSLSPVGMQTTFAAGSWSHSFHHRLKKKSKEPNKASFSQTNNKGHVIFKENCSDELSETAVLLMPLVFTKEKWFLSFRRFLVFFICFSQEGSLDSYTLTPPESRWKKKHSPFHNTSMNHTACFWSCQVTSSRDGQWATCSILNANGNSYIKNEKI